MVLFVYGPTHVGKTHFANQLAVRIGVSALSVDLLKMGLIRSGLISLTPEDDDALADEFWPVLREMVRTALENDQQLIVEGDYLPVNWRSSFAEDDPVTGIGLAMSETHLRTHYGDILHHRHAAE